MSKKRSSSSNAKKPAAQTPAMDNNHVRIANGAGRQPIILEFKAGETYEELFKRANVSPAKTQTVTTGKKTIKDFKQVVEAGSTITIANKPNNG